MIVYNDDLNVEAFIINGEFQLNAWLDSVEVIKMLDNRVEYLIWYIKSWVTDDRHGVFEYFNWDYVYVEADS